MTTYIVTAKGAGVLKFGDAPLYEGQTVPAEDWDTRVSLVAQGLILYVPDAIVASGVGLPDDFPYKGVLEQHGLRSLESVHFLTDRQLIALPEIGEAAVRDIRDFVALERGQEVLSKDEVELSDVLSESEAAVILLVRGDRTLPVNGSEVELSSTEMTLMGIFANAGVLPAFLPLEQREVLLLSRPDVDPAAILEAMRTNEGTYTLSEPLKLLLGRLGLTYPPPAPATPDEGEVPPPVELEHPASDPEKEAETSQDAAQGEADHPRGEEVKDEPTATPSRGKPGSKRK